MNVVLRNLLKQSLFEYFVYKEKNGRIVCIAPKQAWRWSGLVFRRRAGPMVEIVGDPVAKGGGGSLHKSTLEVLQNYLIRMLDIHARQCLGIYLSPCEAMVC